MKFEVKHNLIGIKRGVKYIACQALGINSLVTVYHKAPVFSTLNSADDCQSATFKPDLSEL